jgi:hypothetical protein
LLDGAAEYVEVFLVAVQVRNPYLLNKNIGVYHHATPSFPIFLF